MKIVAFILLLPMLAFGQAFTPRRPFTPFVPSGAPEQTNIVYSFPIFLWWVAADVPVGQSVSNQWKDRVQGRLMKNADTNMPISTTNGIYFDGTTWLTNDSSGFLYGGGGTFLFLFVFKPMITDSAFWYYIDTVNFSLVGNNWYVKDGGFGDFFGQPPLHTNMFDLLMFEKSEATNGVVNRAYSGSNLGNGGRAGYLANWGSVNSSNKYVGYIQEIILWTNTGINGFDGAQMSLVRSNMHWYATNRYHYAP